MNTEKDDTVARPQRATPNLAGRIEGHLQGKTLAGLMQLAPLLVTIFLIAFIVGHVDALVRPLPYISGRPWDFPGIGLIPVIVIFYLVGLLISTAVGRRIMGWNSAALGHIPVIKTIFGAAEMSNSATSATQDSRNAPDSMPTPHVRAAISGEGSNPGSSRALGSPSRITSASVAQSRRLLCGLAKTVSGRTESVNVGQGYHIGREWPGRYSKITL